MSSTPTDPQEPQLPLIRHRQQAIPTAEPNLKILELPSGAETRVVAMSLKRKYLLVCTRANHIYLYTTSPAPLLLFERQLEEPVVDALFVPPFPCEGENRLLVDSHGFATVTRSRVDFWNPADPCRAL